MFKHLTLRPAHRALAVVSLAGLCALASSSGARAATFTVADGDVYGPSGLIAALNAANNEITTARTRTHCPV